MVLTDVWIIVDMAVFWGTSYGGCAMASSMRDVWSFGKIFLGTWFVL